MYSADLKLLAQLLPELYSTQSYYHYLQYLIENSAKGAFQGLCKQLIINKHNKFKNPRWQEADQLAIIKKKIQALLFVTLGTLESYADTSTLISEIKKAS